MSVVRSIALVLFLSLPIAAFAEAERPIENDRFEKQVVVQGGTDIMQMAIAPDGRLFYIERYGVVHVFDPATGTGREVGRLNVGFFGEVGLVGLALSPDFSERPLVYLFYCPQAKPDFMRLSRFAFRDGKLDMAGEEVLLEYGIEKDYATHMGGGLVMTRGGDLFIGTGDNTIPIPELPIDQRPGNEYLDAMRSSGNSNDLRGAILRIHPEPEGGYTCPPGNLFADAKDGRPEIYAMGCRNPFRISYDEQTGTLYWGDVGPNITMDVPIGPNGYDEFNATRTAGNFGWPMFVGPNEAYHRYDFATGEMGEAFDPDHPVNDSRNNTGIKNLPPARPAIIWYPSGESAEFPELGTGGRSAMSGPVYHHRPEHDPQLKLPAHYDGALFVFDWTRNWIKAVWLTDQGGVSRIEPFMADHQFRKPIHLVLADDGTLYLVEFGDQWVNNRDSQIVRLVYRRGNRPPRPMVAVDNTVGKAPLEATLDASGTTDPDAGDVLDFKWQLDGKPLDNEGSPTARVTLTERGRHMVKLVVTDSAGATSSIETEISVGNAPPTVDFLQPIHGSFFEWGDLVKYRVHVADEEDGTSEAHQIADTAVVVKASYQQRRRSSDEEQQLAPGLALMQKSTCFSCHATSTESGGPAYLQVAKKYATDGDARTKLANKILAGGSGVWGKKAMPAHPQHTLEEAEQMAAWILSLAWDRTRQVMSGHDGVFQLPDQPDHRGNAGVVLLEAEYVDLGAGDIPAARGSASHVLHAKRKKPAFADRLSDVKIVDVFEGEGDLVGFFRNGGVTVFEQMNLEPASAVRIRAARLTEQPAAVELHVGSAEGPLAAQWQLPADEALQGKFTEQTVPIAATAGVHDLYLVVSSDGTSTAEVAAVSWMEFEVQPARVDTMKVLLVPIGAEQEQTNSALRLWCNLLAKALNQIEKVEAIVSPDADWPNDHRVVADSRAIVFCHSPPVDFDIDSTPEAVAAHVELMERLGVGVTFLHLVDARQHAGAKSMAGQLVPAASLDWTAGKVEFDEPLAWPMFTSRHDAWLVADSGQEEQPVAWLRAPEGAGRRVDIVAPTAPRLALNGPLLENLLRAALWSGWRNDLEVKDIWLDPSLVPIEVDENMASSGSATPAPTYDRSVPGGWVLPPAASTFATDVDNLFWFISAVGIAIAAAVVAIGAAFCIRYRHREDHHSAPSPSHNLALEVAWTVLPVLLLGVIFFRGFTTYLDMRVAPDDAFEITVRAKKWSWAFGYPNGHVDEELHVPADRPVRLLMSSDDVIHSLFIPAFRVKMDCVPGRYTSVWFQAEEPTPEGFSHPLFCAEYCGTQHSRMMSRVVVHVPEAFDEWLRTAHDAAMNLTPVEAGQRLYQVRGCSQCHSIDGTTRAGGGPSFLGTFGTKQQFASGVEHEIDENYVRESILSPTAKVRAGFRPLMPTYQGQLSDQQIDQLIAFIKSLADDTAATGSDPGAPDGTEDNP